MNVLSLFDGMSCGQIALDQLGIPVNKYYAAEIDPYAMRITQNNYPDTIHLGDVTKVVAEDLPQIDLLLGGSPCQGFSFAGKQLNFDDPRSALFFEFVRLLEETNPKYFLLENVRMKQEYQDVITEHLGVAPIVINSALVSAQNRIRLYWTNIPNITQPEDKGIVLKHILETDYIGDDVKDTVRNQRHYKQDDQKALTCTATMWKGAGNNGMTLVENKDRPIQVGVASDINGHDILKRIYSPEGKSPTLNSMNGGNRQPKVSCGAFRGRYYDHEGKRTDHKESVAGKTTQHLEIRDDEKTNTLTTVQKDNVVVYKNEQHHKENYIKLRDESKEKVLATQMNNSKNFGNAVREKKAFTLRAARPNGVIDKEQYYYRKLTPLECERLQTVPDGYTEGVSNTQRYKMLGNGWTVEVIKHILQNIT